jgi:hypothetical protein
VEEGDAADADPDLGAVEKHTPRRRGGRVVTTLDYGEAVSHHGSSPGKIADCAEVRRLAGMHDAAQSETSTVMQARRRDLAAELASQGIPQAKTVFFIRGEHHKREHRQLHTDNLEKGFVPDGQSPKLWALQRMAELRGDQFEILEDLHARVRSLGAIGERSVDERRSFIKTLWMMSGKQTPAGTSRPSRPLPEAETATGVHRSGGPERQNTLGQGSSHEIMGHVANTFGGLQEQIASMNNDPNDDNGTDKLQAYTRHMRTDSQRTCPIRTRACRGHLLPLPQHKF